MTALYRRVDYPATMWNGSLMFDASRGGRAQVAHMDQPRIAVIGAGIAGLTLARALQVCGLTPRVYEQSTVLGEVGAGLTITPNASHVLHAIGLQPALDELAMRPDRGGVKDWRTGELLVEISRGAEMLAKYGAPYYQIHRADLHAALVKSVVACDPQAIELGREFRELEDAHGRVQVTFADGHRIDADVVIGADGIRSKVRRQLFGDGQPRFTGYVAYRGLVEHESLPPGIIEPTSCISTGPGCSFTRYLLREGRLVNYVALTERKNWQEEGWSIRASVGELLQEFSGWYSDIHTIIRATPETRLFKWALFDREPLPSWTRGAVTLLGDAAHPMLPFLGQGAAMGIEDALVFARAFTAAHSINEGLRRYEEARLHRANWVMLESRKTAVTYHSGRREHFTPGKHVSAESLGLMTYNPTAVAV